MKVFVILHFLSIWINFVFAQSTISKLYPFIYTDLPSWPCVRLLNATTTIGCSSNSATSGILYEVTSEKDLNDFINENYKDSYTIVLPYDLLTRANIATLQNNGRVSGVLVLTSDVDSSAAESPGSTCPNCDFGLYADNPDRYVWNPEANDILDESFSFPIFGLKKKTATESTVYYQIKAALKYNKDRSYIQYPLRAVEMNSFMWGAVNSETCLRRGWCQPVGGMSVFSTPSLDINANDNKPIIMLTAAMDSQSIFHDLTVGAESSVSGLVVLLAVAEALSRAPISPASLQKNILYAAFAGEPWAFAGSQRFVQDISNPFVCLNTSRAVPCPYLNAPCTSPCVRDTSFTKINFNQIEAIIDFQSLTGLNSGYGNYFLHTDDKDISKNLTDILTQSNSTLIKLADSDGVERKLPPSSAMSFLSQKRNISAVVLSDFQKELGRFYDSDLDDKLDLDPMAQSMCEVVSSSARSVYALAQNQAIPDTSISANCTLVQDLMDCLVSNFSCAYIQNFFNVSGLSQISHYVSVYDFDNPEPQFIERLVFSILGYLNGQVRTNSSCYTIRDCNADEYCFMSRCTRTMTAYHDAYGTGLKYNDATDTVSVVDTTKGTWTESTWSPIVFRLFLTTSLSHQIVELVVGVIWTIVSAVVVVLLKSRFVKIFKIE